MLTREPFDFFRKLHIEVSAVDFLYFFVFFSPLALAEIPANLEGRTSQ